MALDVRQDGGAVDAESAGGPARIVLWRRAVQAPAMTGFSRGGGSLGCEFGTSTPAATIRQGNSRCGPRTDHAPAVTEVESRHRPRHHQPRQLRRPRTRHGWSTISPLLQCLPAIENPTTAPPSGRSRTQVDTPPGQGFGPEIRMITEAADRLHTALPAGLRSDRRVGEDRVREPGGEAFPAVDTVLDAALCGCDAVGAPLGRPAGSRSALISAAGPVVAPLLH